MIARSFFVIVLGLLASAMAGCGGSELPSAADPERAQAALQETLTAWRDGASSDELAKRTPPVYVADEQWLAGMKLHQFEVLSAGTPLGNNLHFEVMLQVADPAAGSAQPQKARYTVATDPVVSVVREDRVLE